MMSVKSTAEGLSPLLEELLEQTESPEPIRGPDMRKVPDEFLTDAGKAVKGWQAAKNAQPPNVEAGAHEQEKVEASTLAAESEEKEPPAEQPAEPPPGFDADRAMVLLFGDFKAKLVAVGYDHDEVKQMEEEDPLPDIVASLVGAIDPDAYEFVPPTNPS